MSHNKLREIRDLGNKEISSLLILKTGNTRLTHGRLMTEGDNLFLCEKPGAIGSHPWTGRMCRTSIYMPVSPYIHNLLQFDAIWRYAIVFFVCVYMQTKIIIPCLLHKQRSRPMMALTVDAGDFR